LILVILITVLVYFLTTGDSVVPLMVAIVGFLALLLFIIGVNYTAVMQKKLLKESAMILLDQAIALEENQATVDRRGKNSSVFMIEKPNTRFRDVAGMKGVKEEIKKAIVYPFEHPNLYRIYGKRSGEGILLYGPPGCGKTLIARAAAGELGVSFLSIKVSDILSKWVGESEKNIQLLFEQAYTKSPSIIFIDELDAIGGKRGGSSEGPTRRLVNELLAQMDGIEGTRDKVLILAATNEPWSIDPALRRPGRFTKLIFVPPPDTIARKEIIKIYLKERPIDKDIDYDRLAAITQNYSAADIRQICDEAADIPLRAAMRGNKIRKIGMDDLEAAIKRRKPSLLSWVRLSTKRMEYEMETEIFEEMSAYLKEYDPSGNNSSDLRNFS